MIVISSTSVKSIASISVPNVLSAASTGSGPHRNATVSTTTSLGYTWRECDFRASAVLKPVMAQSPRWQIHGWNYPVCVSDVLSTRIFIILYLWEALQNMETLFWPVFQYIYSGDCRYLYFHCCSNHARKLTQRSFHNLFYVYLSHQYALSFRVMRGKHSYGSCFIVYSRSFRCCVKHCCWRNGSVSQVCCASTNSFWISDVPRSSKIRNGDQSDYFSLYLLF